MVEKRNENKLKKYLDILEGIDYIKTMTTKHQLFNLENAHAFLVQAAKLAHINKSRHAEKISKLIDSLEEILEQENFHLTEESSK